MNEESVVISSCRHFSTAEPMFRMKTGHKERGCSSVEFVVFLHSPALEFNSFPLIFRSSPTFCTHRLAKKGILSLHPLST